MHITQACFALVGLASTVMAASGSPSLPIDPTAGMFGDSTTTQSRVLATIAQQQVAVPNLISLQGRLQNLGRQALISEQQFAMRIQAELALANQLDTIKNNVRINHFRNKFRNVNTVIMTVQSIVDVRDPSNVNTRFMVNQLLADNGAPNSQAVVMVTASETMTIGARATSIPRVPFRSGENSGLNNPRAGIFSRDNGTSIESTSVSTGPGADTLSSVNAGRVGADDIFDQLISRQNIPSLLRNYDSRFPFGRINQAVLLPFGTRPPTAQLVLPDPASILSPGGADLFLQSFNSFTHDCAAFASTGNSFNSPRLPVFPNFQQLAAQQALGLVLGTVPPPALPLVGGLGRFGNGRVGNGRGRTVFPSNNDDVDEEGNDGNSSGDDDDQEARVSRNRLARGRGQKREEPR